VSKNINNNEEVLPKYNFIGHPYRKHYQQHTPTISSLDNEVHERKN
jgi:NADH:ubiquinone oxidoreductase subunit C